VVENILTAHPDVSVIWAANEGGTVGAVTAVNNKGKAGKVFVFGTDISNQLASFLLAEDGVLIGVTGQQPYQMGVTALESSIEILKGKEFPARIVIPSVSYIRDKPNEVKDYLEKMK
jgi:ABC-type sugar transport system substrate-binding protein